MSASRNTTTYNIYNILSPKINIALPKSSATGTEAIWKIIIKQYLSNPALAGVLTQTIFEKVELYILNHQLLC